MDDEARFGVGFNDAAHGLERAHGADAILAGKEAGDDGGAVGERGEKDGAMGEAFVAGDADFAAETADLSDGEGGGGRAAHRRLGCISDKGERVSWAILRTASNNDFAAAM